MEGSLEEQERKPPYDEEQGGLSHSGNGHSLMMGIQFPECQIGDMEQIPSPHLGLEVEERNGPDLSTC